MKVYYIDETDSISIVECNIIEFSSDNNSIIIEECELIPIEDVVKIKNN